MSAAVPEVDRAAGTRAASEARRGRAELKAALRDGSYPHVQALADSTTDSVPYLQGMRVYDFIRTLPWVGRIKAERMMDRLGISRTRRLGGLGINQRRALALEAQAALRRNGEDEG